LIQLQTNEANKLPLQSVQRIRVIQAHDDAGSAKVGDTVAIAPAGRKISAKKSYILLEVLKRGRGNAVMDTSKAPEAGARAFV